MGRGKTTRHPAYKVYPYLLRHLAIEQANHVWAMNIIYLPMQRGFIYLAAVIDWATRLVLAWRVSNTLTADFCIEAVEEAIGRYGKPGIFNTDQGTQFTSDERPRWLQSGFASASGDALPAVPVAWLGGGARGVAVGHHGMEYQKNGGVGRMVLHRFCCDFSLARAESSFSDFSSLISHLSSLISHLSSLISHLSSTP